MVRRSLLLLALLLPPLAAAATPSEGVALKVRRGFFTETDVGVYFSLGGDLGYSNAETYLQLGIGYDLSENIELALNVGVGANASDCFAGRKGTNVDGTPDTNTDCLQSDNFTNTFIDLNVAYLFRVWERLYVAPKLAGGYTLLDPAPAVRASGALMTAAPNLGVGVGVEYASSMDHFSVGVDVMVRFVIGPAVITSMAIFPRVKYTF